MNTLEQLLRRHGRVLVSAATALGIATTPISVFAEDTPATAHATKTGRLAVDDPAVCMERVKEFYTKTGQTQGPVLKNPKRSDEKGVYGEAKYYVLTDSEGEFFKSITGLETSPRTVVAKDRFGGWYTFYAQEESAPASLIYLPSQNNNGFMFKKHQQTKQEYEMHGVVLEACEYAFLNPIALNRKEGKDLYPEIAAIVKNNREGKKTDTDAPPAHESPVPTAAPANVPAQPVEETAALKTASGLVGDFVIKSTAPYTNVTLDATLNHYLVQGLRYTVTTTQGNDEVYAMKVEDMLETVRDALLTLKDESIKVSMEKGKVNNRDAPQTISLTNISELTEEALFKGTFSQKFLRELYKRISPVGNRTHSFEMTHDNYIFVAMDQKKKDIDIRFARVFPQSVGDTVMQNSTGTSTTIYVRGNTITTTQQRYDAQNPTLTNRDVVWFGSLQDLGRDTGQTVSTQDLKDQKTLRDTVVALAPKMKNVYPIMSATPQQEYVIITADERGLAHIVNKTYTGDIGQLVKVESVTIQRTVVMPGSLPKQEPAKVYTAAGQEASISYVDGKLTAKEGTCLVPASAFVGATLEGRTLAPKDLPIYAATSARMATLQRANADPAANAYALRQFTGGDYKKCVDPKVAARASEVHVSIPISK